MTMQRRVSPRFQNLANDGKSSIEKIPNGSDSKKPPNARVSPRLQNAPLEKRPYYGSSRKERPLNASQDILVVKKLKVENSTSIEKIPNGSNSKKPPNTRVSPRLQNIPLEKGLLNACSSGKKKPLNASQDILVKKLKVENSTSIAKIPNGSNSKKPPNTRVSPRLQNIPLEKRPYYGSSQKKKPLNASQDTLVVKKLKFENSTSIEKIPNGSNSKNPPNMRASPRLQNIPLEKRPYYGSSWKKKPLNASQDILAVKKLKVENSTTKCVSNVYDLDNGSVIVEKDETDARDSEEIGSKQGNCSDFLASVPDLCMVMRVKNVLRLFNKYYLHFAKEEDKRCNRVKVGDHEITNATTTDRGNACHDNVRRFKRPDLKTISEMLKKNEVLCHERIFGDLPGIEVGHQFYSRAEMVALGLHRQLVNEIDYVGESYGILEYSGYTFPLATAIVLSSQYEDDFDNKEEIVYTGEGGNDLLGNKRQVKDQVLLCGNLALKNNKEQTVPVRVIRGHNCDDSYSKRLYIYDGLYEVIDYWDEKGISGFRVFKYSLKRLRRQDKLTCQNQVHFVRGKVSRAHSESGLVCKDISNGQEDKCIPVLNLYNPPVAPTGFKYIKSIQVAKDVSIPPDAPGCNCGGKCTNPRSCSCAQLNGGDFPYVSRDGGRLLEAKDVVFECGPRCGCGPQCVNRTSQWGLRYRLEVYCTKDKGWAVRSQNFIPSGAPVCEYIGVLRRNDELEDISENDYIFEIDCWHTMKGIGGRERRLGDVCLRTSNLVTEVDEKTLESEPEPEFCIDASSFGNVARFINHSCDPNLFVQCVLSSHHDVRLARIVLFAADDIPPMQELTYDYNYAIDSVVGPDGKTKQLPCSCGAADCRKRLY